MAGRLAVGLPAAPDPGTDTEERSDGPRDPRATIPTTTAATTATTTAAVSTPRPQYPDPAAPVRTTTGSSRSVTRGRGMSIRGGPSAIMTSVGAVSPVAARLTGCTTVGAPAGASGAAG